MNIAIKCLKHMSFDYEKKLKSLFGAKLKLTKNNYTTSGMISYL